MCLRLREINECCDWYVYFLSNQHPKAYPSWCNLRSGAKDLGGSASYPRQFGVRVAELHEAWADSWPEGNSWVMVACRYWSTASDEPGRWFHLAFVGQLDLQPAASRACLFWLLTVCITISRSESAFPFCATLLPLLAAPYDTSTSVFVNHRVLWDIQIGGMHHMQWSNQSLISVGFSPGTTSPGLAFLIDDRYDRETYPMKHGTYMKRVGLNSNLLYLIHIYNYIYI